MLHVVTGATGLLGSHVAERLVAAGRRVRALVRPESDTAFLREIGVELAVGDVRDADSVRAAVAGAAVVYHCAARVSDWGPWSGFVADVVEPAGRVAEACRAAGVGRLLHVSSISVYGRPRLRPGEEITEDAPLGQHFLWWDHYARAKLLAEEAVRASGASVTIVRPAWCYGERDRVTIPRVVAALRAGKAVVLGAGDNGLNLVYAGDVADGILAAADHPDAAGEAFNLSGTGEVTQRRLMDTVTGELGLPPVTRQVPFGVALWGAFGMELVGRLTGSKRPPAISRRAVYLVGRSARYSTAKAREWLGWRPTVGVEEGVRRALAWFLAEERARQARPA
jgi:nucleoside-diphosphate-sugar epimerase